MKKLLMVVLISGCLLTPFRARAFDPSMMMSSLPQALALANLWSPHVIQGFRAGGIGFMRMGDSLLHIGYLPLGLGECTLGAPFGKFWQGCDHTVTGMLAPIDFVYQTVMLPIRFFSLGSVN